jgi:hypothetical protein
LSLRVSGEIMQTFLAGVLIIGIGAVYFAKPTIFRRGISLRTSIAIRFLSEENYRRYMKGLGILLMVFGAALVLLALVRYLGVRL